MAENSRAAHAASIQLFRPPEDYLEHVPPDSTSRERRLAIGLYAVFGPRLLSAVDASAYAGSRRLARAVALCTLSWDLHQPGWLDRPTSVTVSEAFALLERAREHFDLFDEVLAELRS